MNPLEMESIKEGTSENIKNESDEVKDSLAEPNLDPIKLGTNLDDIKNPINQQQEQQSLHENKDQKIMENFTNFKTNNNQRVVPIGVLIVLLTIYLGMNNLQKCYVNCIENPKSANIVQSEQNIVNYFEKSENLKINSQIVERFLEYKDICRDLEIFTKDLNLKQLHHQTEDDELIVNDIEMNSGSGYDGNINGNCIKETLTKLRKSKYSIKSSKNGFDKYNKSVKAKFQKNQKKDLNQNKKGSTAEPIIYLFAIVFIYLLLKAASDINQHYKSKNKNDKRLRRCSLQSYAQIHRPDRRASKASSSELGLKQKQLQQQLRLRSLSRSISQDHHYHQYGKDGSAAQISEQLPTIKQHVAQSSSSSSPVRTQTPSSNNWQLIRQHTTTHSLDNSDITTASRINTEFPSMMTRRCSVPATLNYQRHKITSVSPLNSYNDNVNVPLSRRTSITSSSLHLSLEPIDNLGTETKRRVRMINRH